MHGHRNLKIEGREKGKAVPLQAWSGPEGSRKLRFPDYMPTAQDGGKFVSLTHQPPLAPGNTPGTHFCCLGVDSATNINQYQDHFLGVKAAGA